jgi:hypothetical protein
MALTPEQQIQLEFSQAMYAAVQEPSDSARYAHELAMEQRRARLEAVRLAKETLIESARSKPVDERNVSAADIIAFANALEAHISGQ